MIIAKLTISFDRGTQTNDAGDIGLANAPTVTASGGKVRGLGTHYVSAAAEENARQCVNEEARVRETFKRTFLASPIPGTYVLSAPGAGAQVLATLDPPIRGDVAARVSEYVLEPTESLPPAEVADWCQRVGAQLKRVPLGKGARKDWATETAGGAEGIAILMGLAACPVLAESTRNELRDLIDGAKLANLDRVEVRRRLDTMAVEIDVKPVAPRRTPAVPAPPLTVETSPTLWPRARRRA